MKVSSELRGEGGQQVRQKTKAAGGKITPTAGKQEAWGLWAEQPEGDGTCADVWPRRCQSWEEGIRQLQSCTVADGVTPPGPRTPGRTD